MRRIIAACAIWIMMFWNLFKKKGKNSASYNSDTEVGKPSKEKQSDEIGRAHV